MIKDKEIIVTGGAGFIGSNLVEALAKKNKVTVIDNMHTGSEANLRHALKLKNVKLIKKDVKEIGDLDVKADVIFHLGMYSSTPMYRDDNYKVGGVVAGAISVFRYAVKNSSHVVFASSSSIYNGHKPPHREDMKPLVTDFYTEGRIYVERLAELYSRLYGINAIGLRLFSVYGPHEESKGSYANLVSQFIWAVREGRQPVIYGNGNQSRDFTYVDDVVEAFKCGASVKGFGIFNVGTGKSYTLNELIVILGRHFGKKIVAEKVENKMKNYVMHTNADTSKARKILGFKAECSLDQGINKLFQYYKIK